MRSKKRLEQSPGHGAVRYYRHSDGAQHDEGIGRQRPADIILRKEDRLSRDRCDAPAAKKRMGDCGARTGYAAGSLPENGAEQVLMESIYEGLMASFIYSRLARKEDPAYGTQKAAGAEPRQ